MRKILFFFLCFFFVGNLYSKTEQYSLVIIPLQLDSKIPKKQVKKIKNLLYKKIKPLYKLVPENLVQKTYRENSHELLGCIGMDCAVKMANLVHTDKALFARIYKIENGYVIKVIIVDRQTEYIEFSDNIIIEDSLGTKKKLEKFAQNVQSHLYGVPWKHDKSRWPYIWRSSVLPGWGQWHEGNSIKANIFFVSGSILFLNYYISRLAYMKAGKRYEGTPAIPYTVSDNALGYNAFTLYPLKNDLAKKEQYMVKSFYMLSLFWIGNVVDAAFFKYSAADTEFFQLYYNKTLKKIGLKNQYSDNFKFMFFHHF